MKKKALVPLIIFLLGICLVSLIVYKTDTHEKEQRHITAQLNVATYGERIKNEITSGIEITNALKQILISEDGDIHHFETIAGNLISDSIESIQLAPNGVVTDIYPAAGNEAGKIDLIHDKDRGKISCYARDNHTIITQRQPYMDKPHEEAAGYKHRSTDKFMNTFKKTVMDRCQQEGLHQIDLLAPAERKITQKEYMAQNHGQQKLDEINQKIIEDDLKPTSTVFLTQKEYLRNAIDECAATSNSFDEFQSKLLEQFQISVIEHRGRYSYLHPDRQKRITERSLGTRYGKEHLKQTFLRKDPLAILYVRSHLRLVVNLQTNVKAMQSPAYAHRVKLSNLQQMANTIIYVQEHGFDTQSDLKNTLLASTQELKDMQTQVAQHRSNLRILNEQIRYTGQYYANKEVYSQFSKAKYKGKYRKEHAKEIQKYEEARDWLRSFYQDGKMTSLKTLTLQKEKLQQQIVSEEKAISNLKEKLKDLDTADQNVDAILQMQIPEPVKSKTKDLER